MGREEEEAREGEVRGGTLEREWRRRKGMVRVEERWTGGSSGGRMGWVECGGRTDGKKWRRKEGMVTKEERMGESERVTCRGWGGMAGEGGECGCVEGR